MKRRKSKLSERRKAHGLSQREMAKRLGILPSAVCHMEKNGIKSIRAARLYSEVLECDPLELLD